MTAQKCIEGLKNWHNKLDTLELHYYNFKHWFFSHLQWIADNWQNFEFAIAVSFLIGVCCGVGIMIIAEQLSKVGKDVKREEEKIREDL